MANTNWKFETKQLHVGQETADPVKSFDGGSFAGSLSNNKSNAGSETVGIKIPEFLQKKR